MLGLGCVSVNRALPAQLGTHVRQLSPNRLRRRFSIPNDSGGPRTGRSCLFPGQETWEPEVPLVFASDCARMTSKPEVIGPRIDVENRPTRTLFEPDGICSSGVGQHPATALAPPLGRITPIPSMCRQP